MWIDRDQAIIIYKEIIERKLPLLGFSVGFDTSYYMGRKSVITHAFHKSVEGNRPFCVERHSDYFGCFQTEEAITYYTKHVIRLFIEAVFKHDEETRSNK